MTEDMVPPEGLPREECAAAESASGRLSGMTTSRLRARGRDTALMSTNKGGTTERIRPFPMRRGRMLSYFLRRE